MGQLKRVTITGADDLVSPGDLFELSAVHPFVEWGILVSASKMGTTRYPSRVWMSSLATKMVYMKTPINIAVHIQGRWLRDLVLGDSDDLIDGCGSLIRHAQRIQLNFHGGVIDWNETAFLMELATFPLTRDAKQFIFQIDGCQGGAILERVSRYGHGLDLVPFYDTSHGAGVLPEVWPDAEKSLLALTRDLQVGYAGGLGPENLAAQIPLIAKAAGKAQFWIDMETKIRSPSPLVGTRFDLDKVRAALEICKPFVGVEIA